MFSKDERKLWRIATALEAAAWLVLLAGGIVELLHLAALSQASTERIVVWSAQVASVLWKMLWVWTASLLLRGVSLGLRVIIEIRHNLTLREEGGE